MKLEEFSEKSQLFFSSLISKTSFNLEDARVFGKLRDPLNLNKKQYQAYFFNKLAKFKPNAELADYPILYTFFIMCAPIDIKKAFVDEFEKRAKGEKFNEELMNNYYSNFLPGLVEFDRLLKTMSYLLSQKMYPDKGYFFTNHLVTLTKDFDFALIFVEVNSVTRFIDFSKDKADLVYKPTL